MGKAKIGRRIVTNADERVALLKNLYVEDRHTSILLSMVASSPRPISCGFY